MRRKIMQATWKQARAFIQSKYLWWGIVLLGILLRLHQYLLNRSLWADEASLAVNLVKRSFAELTQLLDYHQAAPVGFLFIEKLFVFLLGNHDYVMRLFPLFGGILGVYLIYRISRASFGTAGLFAVLMFSISWWLVHYSTELKQYSSDVMVALLLVYLAMICLRENARARDFLILGLAGAVVIWISHPSVFIMVGIGLALALEKMTRKAYVPWSWILGIGLGWLASFVLEYFLSLRHIVADEYLIDYWRKAYVPLPPWSDWGWFRDTYYSFLFFAFHRADDLMALVTLVLTTLGAISLLMRDRKIAILVISPFVVAVVTSALQRYPLKERFMLFLIPFALLLMAEGLRGIYWLAVKWRPGFAAVFSGAIALAVLWQIVPITFEKAVSEEKTDIRPVMEYIAENRLPDDVLYVFPRTDPVFNYYAPFYGLDTGNVVIGVDSPRKRLLLENYTSDVDSLVGKERVWFLFSELIDCVECEGEDTQPYYLEYIDQYGVIIDSFDGSGANAYLYDLSLFNQE
jgi:hypothetical protein